MEFYCIALEPAFPWFRLHDESLRVGKGDANFVDVWHTNSGKLIDVRERERERDCTSKSPKKSE